MTGTTVSIPQRVEVIVNYGAPGAPGAGVPVGGNTGDVLQKLSGAANDTGWAPISANALADGSLGNAKLANMAAATFKGRDTGGGAGAPQDLTVATVQAMLGLGALAYIPDAPSDGTQYARIDGAWASITVGAVNDDSVTNAKLANVATATIKGRTTAGLGDPEDLTVGQVQTMLGLGALAYIADAPSDGNQYTRIDGTWAQVVTGTPADDTITNAKLANVASNTLKGRTDPGTGDPTDLTVGDVQTMLGLGALAYINDAPSDGNQYARIDGTWAQVAASGGVTYPLTSNTTNTLGRDVDNSSLLLIGGDDFSLGNRGGHLFLFGDNHPTEANNTFLRGNTVDIQSASGTDYLTLTSGGLVARGNNAGTLEIIRNAAANQNTAIRFTQLAGSWYTGVGPTNSYAFRWNNADLNVPDVSISQAGEIFARGLINTDTAIETNELRAAIGDTVVIPVTALFTPQNDSDVSIAINRASATGRAQMAFRTEGGSEIWRLGTTGAGGTDLNFFDGSNNILSLSSSLANVSTTLSCGQVIRADGASAPASGAGLELSYATNIGFVTSFDRSAAQYRQMDLRASSFNFFDGTSNALSITTTAAFDRTTRAPEFEVFDGIQFARYGTGFIELGRTDGTASTPFLDFHSGATSVDYDARIIAEGGLGTNGAGTIKILAGDIRLGGNGTSHGFSADTNDGSDTWRLQLAGGGSPVNNRGGYINVHGNEFTGQEGDVALVAGNTATSGAVRIFTQGAQRCAFNYDGTTDLSASLRMSDGTGNYISNTSTAGLMRISGGTANNGAVIVMGGDSNGSIPNQGKLRVGATDILTWQTPGITAHAPAVILDDSQVLLSLTRPAINADVDINFNSQNNGSTLFTFGKIRMEVADANIGSEDGLFRMQVLSAGSLVEAAIIAPSVFSIESAMLRAPRSVSNPPSGQNGAIYYNTTTHKLRVYANGSWVDLH